MFQVTHGSLTINLLHILLCVPVCVYSYKMTNYQILNLFKRILLFRVNCWHISILMGM